MTGGPASGKSSVIESLKLSFPDEVIIVPEVATMLLEGGFPLPGRDVDWSEEWQEAFQDSIFAVQANIEKAFLLSDRKNQKSIMVLDRALPDGAAYTPGGMEVFCKRHSTSPEDLFGRYDFVMYLQSLAVLNSHLYGKMGNENRFEPLEVAIPLENRTREVWQGHPQFNVIEGRYGIEHLINEAKSFVERLIKDE